MKSSTGTKIAVYTLDGMRELASSRGGVCLSTAFVDPVLLLRWRCAEGHRFDAAPVQLIQDKSWCPVCRLDTIQRGQARRAANEAARAADDWHWN